MTIRLIKFIGSASKQGNFLFACLITLLILAYTPGVESQDTRVDYRLANLQNRACSSGRIQSPIHLTTLNSTYNDSIFLASDSYLTIQDAILRYNGQLLEIASLGALNGFSSNHGFVTLKKEGIISKYNLKKVVIHTPAEHVIDGIRHDLEIKFIHEKDLDYKSAVNDFKTPSDINMFLVVSVLYSTVGTYVDNNFIDRLFDYYRTNTNINQTTFNLELEETRLFRNRRFFFYEGSDTVDPCDETHLYYVVADVFRIQSETLSQFRNTYSNFYNNTNFNKPVSEYHGRTIVRNFYTEDDFTIRITMSWIFLSLIVIIL